MTQRTTIRFLTALGLVASVSLYMGCGDDVALTSGSASTATGGNTGSGGDTATSTSSSSSEGGGISMGGAGGSIPTCEDGLVNGDETDMDCGGSCGPCPNGAACEVADDCVSGACTGQRCGLWGVLIGGAESVQFEPERAYGVAVDPSGDVVVVAAFTGTGTLLGDALISAGGSDVAVAKVSPSGNVFWSRTIGGTGGEAAFDVTTATNGDIVVAGRFQSTVSFGGTASDCTSSGGRDVLVVRLDGSTGDAIWARCFGGSSNDEAHGVAVAPNGDVVVGGEFRSASIDVGAGVALSSAGADTNPDGFIVALSGVDGQPQWGRTYGADGADASVRSVAATATGVAAGGFHRGAVDFGEGPISTYAGGADFFVLSLGSGGGLDWVRTGGGTGTDAVDTVDVAADGSVYATGSYAVAFSLGPLSVPEPVDPGSDVLVLKFGATGALQWAFGGGGNGSDFGQHLAATEDGVIVAGEIRGTNTNFGGGPLPNPTFNEDTLFLLRLDSSSGAHLASTSFPAAGADTFWGLAFNHERGALYGSGVATTSFDFGEGGLAVSGPSDGFLVSFGSLP